MSDQQFGGHWTEDKLLRLRKYLHAYSIALKNQPFRRTYFDAFAGTGFRAPQSRRNEPGFLFPEIEHVVKGAASIAREVEPPYDRDIFVQSNRQKYFELQKLASQYSQLADRIEFKNQVANTAIEEFCKATDWLRNRA